MDRRIFDAVVVLVVTLVIALFQLRTRLDTTIDSQVTSVADMRFASVLKASKKFGGN